MRKKYNFNLRSIDALIECEKRYELLCYRGGVEKIIVLMCADNDDISTNHKDYASFRAFINALDGNDVDNVLALDDEELAKLV